MPLRLKNILNSLIMSKEFLKSDNEPFKVSIVSSAYCTVLNILQFILIPEIKLDCLINIPSISLRNKNKYGDKGSP